MTTEELIKALREKPSRDNRALLDEAADQLELAQKTIIALTEDRMRQETEIEKVRYKLECLLCHATGGKLSKSTYSLRTMEIAVTDFMQEIDEEVVVEATVNAVKEFAERLKTKADGWYYDFADLDDTMDALMEIDNLVKEFTGGEADD